MCMNLNENATKYDIFITTSVLLAGNSIDRVHFDKCYVFVGDKTDNPRSIHQMIKRVRNLTDNEIVSHITYSEHIDHKYDMIDIQNWMKSTEKYMNEPNNWFNSFDYNEHGILEHKSNIYYDLFCRYKHQKVNMHCYLSWYIGLCYENKYNVTITNDIPAEIVCEIDHQENKHDVKLEHYEQIANVELPTEHEYNKMKQCTYNKEEKLNIEKFVFTANYHLIDKTEVHDDTINDVEFVTFYFPSKRRKQFKYLLNIAYKADTYDLFIEYINKKTKNETQHYQDTELFQRVINALNDIMKLLGFVNLGDIEDKIVDGLTLKDAFDANKNEILDKYSKLLYQMKLEKKDIKNYDFGKFIKSFNAVLDDLTSGKFINVSDNKKHDIRYRKYKFVHGFITNGEHVVHDAVTIKFRPFNNFCALNDDDGVKT